MEEREVRTVLETERLLLRKMDQQDLPDLQKILQDPAVMYAYEGPFDEAETQAWLDKQLRRYQEDGVGLYAVILKNAEAEGGTGSGRMTGAGPGHMTGTGSGRMIGQCGLTMQEIPGKRVLEVGYLFQKAYWHKGYATEAARACRDYAFNVLGAEEVFSIIRDTNIPSQKVAVRNGMVKTGTFVKHYRGVEMPHDIFSVTAQIP